MGVKRGVSGQKAAVNRHIRAMDKALHDALDRGAGTLGITLVWRADARRLTQQARAGDVHAQASIVLAGRAILMPDGPGSTRPACLTCLSPIPEADAGVVVGVHGHGSDPAMSEIIMLVCARCGARPRAVVKREILDALVVLLPDFRSIDVHPTVGHG